MRVLKSSKAFKVSLRRKAFRATSVQLDFRYDITQIMKQVKLKVLPRKRIMQMLLCNIFEHLMNSRIFFSCHSRRLPYREHREIFPALQQEIVTIKRNT